MTATKVKEGIDPHVDLKGVDPKKELTKDEVEKLKPQMVTFFSRYKEDELYITPASRTQDGPNHWVTIPAKVVKFRDRCYVTNDAEKIEWLRNHPYYGRQIFEFGKPEHEKRIATLDDAGRIAEMEKFSRIGRFIELRYRANIE